MPLSYYFLYRSNNPLVPLVDSQADLETTTEDGSNEFISPHSAGENQGPNQTLLRVIRFDHFKFKLLLTHWLFCDPSGAHDHHEECPSTPGSRVHG